MLIYYIFSPVIILGFFILAGFFLKRLHEQRLRARLQNELNTLLYDYAPLEEGEIETISFTQNRR